MSRKSLFLETGICHVAATDLLGRKFPLHRFVFSRVELRLRSVVSIYGTFVLCITVLYYAELCLCI